jgi:deoxyribodipyrimidine photolyase-related protein
MIFLILPNQLFDIKYFTKSYKYILWECPHFFTDYNYNKKKLLLHRATMKYQYDLMKKNGYSVVYMEFNKKLAETEQYTLYYPINKLNILNLLPFKMSDFYTLYFLYFLTLFFLI